MGKKLIDDIEGLSEVPEKNARAYKKYLGELVEKVNSIA